MNKREKHKQDLTELLDQALETDNPTSIKDYIAANINLVRPLTT